MGDTVFITGAGRGLGLALVERFLGEGFWVFAGMHATAAHLQRLAERHAETLTIVPLDVTDLSSVRRAVQSIAERSATLDVLINNAGVHLEGADVPLEELDALDAVLQRTMDVNAFGPLRVTQAFLPLLEKGRRKVIANISSDSGSLADYSRTGWYAYAMSKAALNMQSKILQNCLKPHGFKVLAIHPGWMRTDMGGSHAAIHPDEAAEGIFRLTTREWDLDGGIFVDYEGNPMRW